MMIQVCVGVGLPPVVAEISIFSEQNIPCGVRKLDGWIRLMSFGELLARIILLNSNSP
jgi:hypothetical protein